MTGLCVADHPRDRPQSAVVGDLCEWHQGELRWWLTDVEDWYRFHQVFLLPGSAERSERLSQGKRAAPPAPVRLETVAVTDRRVTAGERPRSWYWNGNPVTGRLESNGTPIPDVPGVLGSWASLVAEETGADVRAGTVRDVCRVLRAAHVWVCGQGWVLDYRGELRQCQLVLAKVVGESSGPFPFGDCLYCGASLYDPDELERWAARRERRPARAWLGARVVECRSCGESWEGPEIVRLRLAQKRTS